MKTHAIAVALALTGYATAYGQHVMPAQGVPPTIVLAQSAEAVTVEAADQVLSEIMAIPLKAIPLSLLSDAQGIAIVPGMIKAGFVIGVRRGHGVLLCRDTRGDWQLPEFITVTGGSVGWQAGLQQTDLILVFCSQRSLRGLARGKITIGADAAAAAGPIGRNAAAATDLSLDAEIFSYSRSRGLFAGVAIDGSAIEMDRARTLAYYRTVGAAAPGAAEPLPAEAVKLLEQIARYSAPVAATVPAGPEPTLAEPTLADPEPVPAVPTPAAAAAEGAEALRRQLGESASQLQALVDDQWKRYLALPAEIYDGERPPSAAALNTAVQRYQTVATSPRYRALAQRPEFQATRALLQKYQAAASASSSAPLALPPPPQ